MKFIQSVLSERFGKFVFWGWLVPMFVFACFNFFAEISGCPITTGPSACSKIFMFGRIELMLLVYLVVTAIPSIALLAIAVIRTVKKDKI